MEDKKISVIVPVYKVERYLKKCIESIINQSYRNLEIILVDDGSPDNCGKIIDEYAAKDNRIKAVHQQNGGVACARNAGLENVTGDYIGWVDGDDFIEPEHFSVMAQKAETENCDIVFAYKGIKDEKTVCGDDILKQLLFHILPLFLWSALFKAELFKGEKFEAFNAGEDFLIFIPVCAKSRKAVAFNSNTYNYLSRDNSLLHNDDWKFRINNVEATDFGKIYVEKKLPRFIKYYNYHIINDNIWHYRATQKLEKTPELKEFHELLRSQVKIALKELPKPLNFAQIKKYITAFLFANGLI